MDLSVEWYDVLYQNSAKEIHSTHLLGQIVNKALQVELHTLIDSLRCAVSLRVTSRGDVQFDMGKLAEFLPYLVGKDPVPIRNHGIRVPVQLEDVVHIAFATCKAENGCRRGMKLA